MRAAGVVAPVSPRAELLREGTGLFVVVLLAYLGGAVLAWKVFGSAFGPAFFYPASGVTVAAMLLSRRALWPAVVLAILVAEVAADLYFGNTAPIAIGYALANVVEPLIGATVVLALCGGSPDLRERRDFVAFVAAGCLLAPAAGGLVGGTATFLSDRTDWIGDVLHWWAGDALGVLIVATPLLLWRRQVPVIRSRPGETIALLASTAGVSMVGFWTASPPSTLILPMLAWAALRLNMIGAALAGAVVAFVATAMISRGRGAFAGTDISAPNQLALTQLFVAIIVTVALLVAQESAARTQALRERETERRERLRLEGLSQLAQQLSAALGPEDIAAALKRHAIGEVGASALTLGLVTHDGRRLEWVAMEGYPPEIVAEFGAGVELKEGFVATDSVISARPVLIQSPIDYERHYGAGVRWLTMNQAESLVGWPLAAGGKPFGTLVLSWQQRQDLDPAQVAYISAVATMVSQALVRARVYADEHARAAVLQSAILPTSPQAPPGVEISVCYEPADVAHGLGGDWYDVMALPQKMIYFAVGDVMGHGLPAVEDMAQLRSAGRALAHQGLPPAQVLAELNGFTRHASHSRFATMAVAVFDPATGTLAYCTAGHPPSLLRRAATGQVERLDASRGPVLGPLAETSFTESRVTVHPGDILMMYTDGLVERRGMDIETGISRAEAIVAGWDGDMSLTQECGALHENLAPRPRVDDVCIIAVRFDSKALGAEHYSSQ